jgi:ADP-ribose diphosphatase
LWNPIIAAGDGGLYSARVKQGGPARDLEGWEIVSSESHFANAHVEVRTDRVRTPLHHDPRPWTIVCRKAAVIIAPMTGDGRIVLIQQERIPIRSTIWEMPSGQIDTAHEPNENEIKETALRELREEAGYELRPGGDLIRLGHFFTSPGFTDEHGYFLLASPVGPCPGYRRDKTESIVACRAFSVDELRGMIAANEIRDANTLGICARLAACGFISLGLP